MKIALTQYSEHFRFCGYDEEEDIEYIQSEEFVENQARYERDRTGYTIFITLLDI